MAEGTRRRQRRPAEAGAAEPRYPVGRLIRESYAFLGVSRHAAAGALAGRDPDEELTVAQAKKLASGWSR